MSCIITHIPNPPSSVWFGQQRWQQKTDELEMLRVRGRVGEREREKEVEGISRGRELEERRRELEGRKRERGREDGSGENWTVPLVARLVFPTKLPQLLFKPGARVQSFFSISGCSVGWTGQKGILHLLVPGCFPIPCWIFSSYLHFSK